MRRAALAIAGSLLLILAAGLARRAEQRERVRARELLLWAQDAQECAPHTGTVVTSTYAGSRVLTSEARVTRFTPDEWRIEYLSAPMRGVTIVEHGSRCWRYEPAQRTLFIEGPSEPDQEEVSHDRELLLRNYEPHLLGEAVVAGRPAIGLSLLDAHTRRLAQRLWLDRATGLALVTEEYRPNGMLAMRTAYRQIRFGPPPEPFSGPADASRVIDNESPATPENVLQALLGLPVLRPRYVPPGFDYAGSFRGRCACGCGNPMAHLRFSDGLRAISEFECPHDIGAPTGFEVTPLVQGGMIRLQRGRATFVFVGETDEDELRRMAESLP